mgnify:CR=1 FL=1
MTLEDLFIQINSAYRGSDDDVPASGSPDYTNWLSTTNRKIQEWAKDTKNTWQSSFLLTKPTETGTVATTGTTTLTGTSTYFTDYKSGDTIVVDGETVRTIDTITSDTVLTVTVAFSNTASGLTFTHSNIIADGIQSYSTHRRLLVPSDYITIDTGTDTIKYTIGKPQERDRFSDEVYLSGRQPQILTFYDTISTTYSSNIIGGTLNIPGYYLPADLSASTDIIPVDNPYWLVYSVASELAFNDLTYEDKAIDLNAKANNLYSIMAQSNRRGTSNYPRIARTNVSRIIGPSSERTV